MNLSSGSGNFDYTVIVSQTGYSESDRAVTGKITLTNPNSFAVTGISVTEATDTGVSCTVTGGSNVAVPAGGSVLLDYACTMPGASGGFVAAVASWNREAYGTPSGQASGKAPFDFSNVAAGNIASINGTVTVTDTFESDAGRNAPGAHSAPGDCCSIAALRPLWPVLLSYVLSFLYVGIYWNNHHHMFHSTGHVSGGILWANLHLLFWLSLFPFTTGWVGENHFAATPTAVYGFVLLMAALAYYLLQRAIIFQQGAGSILAAAVGRDWKGKLSPVCYLVAMPLAYLSPWIANGMYFLVALLWLIPDRRIERILKDQVRQQPEEPAVEIGRRNPGP